VGPRTGSLCNSQQQLDPRTGRQEELGDMDPDGIRLISMKSLHCFVNNLAE
jgi:hypothetical protein